MGKVLLAFFLSLTLMAPLSGQPLPNKAKVHGYALTGTVTSVDEGRKSFVVKNSAGKDTRLVWTNATTLSGGKIRTGAKATLRYLDKDGKHIATSVILGDPSEPKTTAAVPVITPAPRT